ncbi:MAG TPA: hypothetical protein VLE97_00100 [Gaiellaceae bacterium]|nr:hypothetical protein [Gaiellaceae bacterium]
MILCGVCGEGIGREGAEREIPHVSHTDDELAETQRAVDAAAGALAFGVLLALARNAALVSIEATS